MRIDILSIFPDYLKPLQLSLVGRAAETGLVELGVHDLRGWTHDRHRTVDDTPYGGGAGMVMRPEPWGEALAELAGPATRLVMLTPSGRPFSQALAHELAGEKHLILGCGRYEGVDARVAADAVTRMRVDEVSIGDYVLNGGEAAALAVTEAVVRLLPGVIGNPESLTEESYAAEHDGLLEYPLYTKPPQWRGLSVPEVLFSGHHAKIAGWRREQAYARTLQHRPDLLREQVLLAPLGPEAAGELFTLQRAAYLSEGRLLGTFEIPPLTESLTEVAESLATGTVLGARLDGRLVGSVRGELRLPHTWCVGRLMVAPDQQERGIGGALFEAVEALAPESVVTFELFTGAASAANLAFYRRRGYAEVERRPAPGVDVIVLRRERQGVLGTGY